MRDISVILIVKDEPGIRETLLKLYPQILKLDAECIVVDASNPTLQDLAIEFPWVCWIEFRSTNVIKKATIPEQRNKGVHSSTGRVIVFCDAGATPDANWLQEITAPILDGVEQLVGGPIYATNEDALAKWINRQSDGEAIRYPTTANLSMTRKAFNLVGGFNEDLAYGSDADFVWRLNREGLVQRCVSTALMGLDGGDADRERRRAWRYGKAMGDLLHLFPEKRRNKFRSNPEIWFYPAIIFLALFSLCFAYFSVATSLCLISSALVLNFALWLRNGATIAALRVICYQYIYGAGLIQQTLKINLSKHRKTKIVIYPADEARYLSELMRALTLEKVDFAPFPVPTPSNSINLLLLPLQSVFLKLRGVKIVHIHWLYRFRVTWSSTKPVQYLFQFWFYLWIFSLKIFGIKVIWTAHNIFPHERIFANDFKARKFLVGHSDSVIAFSAMANQVLVDLLGAESVEVIPEGPLLHPTTLDRSEIRQRLQVADDQILMTSLGSLGGYKGIEDIIEISQKLPENVAIRIAGWCSEVDKRRLAKLITLAVDGGANIEVSFKPLTNNEYGGFLAASDFYLAPFKIVTNSGSINAALSAGLPLIVTDLDSLEWVPQGAAIRFLSDGYRRQNLLSAITAATQLSADELREMIETARNYSESCTWKYVAERHKNVYASAMKTV